MTTRRPTTAAQREANGLPPLKRETAKQAYDRNVAEATRRWTLLGAALNAARLPATSDAAHWGNVGDMSEINSALRQALHYAGVKEFTEK